MVGLSCNGTAICGGGPSGPLKRRADRLRQGYGESRRSASREGGSPRPTSDQTCCRTPMRRPPLSNKPAILNTGLAGCFWPVSLGWDSPGHISRWLASTHCRGARGRESWIARVFRRRAVLRVRGLLFESADKRKKVRVVFQAFNDSMEMVWHQNIPNDCKPVDAGCTEQVLAKPARAFPSLKAEAHGLRNKSSGNTAGRRRTATVRAGRAPGGSWHPTEQRGCRYGGGGPSARWTAALDRGGG